MCICISPNFNSCPERLGEGVGQTQTLWLYTCTYVLQSSNFILPETLQSSNFILPETLQSSNFILPDTLQSSNFILPETLQCFRKDEVRRL